MKMYAVLTAMRNHYEAVVASVHSTESAADKERRRRYLDELRACVSDSQGLDYFFRYEPAWVQEHTRTVWRDGGELCDEAVELLAEAFNCGGEDWICLVQEVDLPVETFVEIVAISSRQEQPA